jgi:hypothetical protein
MFGFACPVKSVFNIYPGFKAKEGDPPPNFGGLTTPVRSAGPTGQAGIH